MRGNAQDFRWIRVVFLTVILAAGCSFAADPAASAPVQPAMYDGTSYAVNLGITAPGTWTTMYHIWREGNGNPFLNTDDEVWVDQNSAPGCSYRIMNRITGEPDYATPYISVLLSYGWRVVATWPGGQGPVVDSSAAYWDFQIKCGSQNVAEGNWVNFDMAVVDPLG